MESVTTLPIKAAMHLNIAFWISLIVSAAHAYYPDEMECPDNLHGGIHSDEYQIPYGAPYRAWRTLPWRYFMIKPSTLPDAGLGVFATTFIATDVWLGEYEGNILHLLTEQEEEEADLTYAWESYCNDRVVHYIDAKDVEVSNWLRFINNPNHVTQQNVESHLCFGKIFYRTFKDIHPGQELFVYYGDDYAEYLGIDLTEFYDIYLEASNKKNNSECEDCNKSWWWW